MLFNRAQISQRNISGTSTSNEHHMIKERNGPERIPDEVCVQTHFSPEPCMMISNDRNGNYKNLAQYNIQNDIRLCMRARDMVPVEGAWSLLESCDVKKDPLAAVYMIHLENERNIIIRPQMYRAPSVVGRC